jgi:pyruvate carboxylase
MPSSDSPKPATPRQKKLLVANRSEIAIRVFRAATELGFRTVAISRGEDKAGLARELGAHEYIDSAKGNAAHCAQCIDVTAPPCAQATGSAQRTA